MVSLSNHSLASCIIAINSLKSTVNYEFVATKYCKNFALSSAAADAVLLK